MQTYYDMLDDGAKAGMAEAWETLAETAAAGRELLDRCRPLRGFSGQRTVELAAAMDAPVVARALAEPDGGGDYLFEDEADAAGASGAEELSVIARDIAARARDAAGEISRAAGEISRYVDERVAELYGVQELADEAVVAYGR